MTETVIRYDHYFDNAAERIAAEGTIGAGRTAGDRYTGNSYLRTTTGWTQISTGGAGNVTVKDTAGNAVDFTQPARDIFIGWIFGSDTVFETLTVNTDNLGSPVDISEINPDTRTLVIQTEGASSSYTYTVYASRSSLDADKFTIKSATLVASGAGSEKTRVVLNGATYGYDQYLHVTINPTIGDAGTKLNYRVYVTGRGG